MSSCEATRGVMIECDIPVKQYILKLNEERPNSEKFVIRDLDDTHLFVQPKVAGESTHDYLAARVKEFNEKNTYVREEANPVPGAAS
mmetsp:Transcript_44625/g.142090  ORF Transcript_44625/g.142090 Transcript_44625/m.142090 type:complete len:87 (+) Transcript_44625:57-317(+)|eukprot:CAMPEP_0182913126 /NCGR_PEP_ID=MMETSP0034_2-20130328/37875_1 /TAXON_ID=156128 /ORGANISM="Nephroselmis pyriformis, Strain CCMP717" /LENGTH=86 /DNA_ID=CAMNT_0025049829 /DNA_START=31 /DNA_END=291 /DNA_ORIENTATION=-